jgi:hypothetical protein
MVAIRVNYRIDPYHEISDRVRSQVSDQIYYQVLNRVRDHLVNQVWNHVWIRIKWDY